MESARLIKPRPRIIGFAGKAGTGKSTLAKAIHERVMLRGHQSLILSFADPIKHMAISMLLYTMPPTEAYNIVTSHKDSMLDIGVTVRRLLQTLGTEWGRETISPTLWVNIMAKRINLLPHARIVLIDDVRFQNEVDMIREMGGVVFQVIRSDNAIPNKSTPSSPDHASEAQALEDVISLDNNRAVENVIADVEYVARHNFYDSDEHDV